VTEVAETFEQRIDGLEAQVAVLDDWRRAIAGLGEALEIVTSLIERLLKDQPGELVDREGDMDRIYRLADAAKRIPL
jgi:hypothetical protein